MTSADFIDGKSIIDNLVWAVLQLVASFVVKMVGSWLERKSPANSRGFVYLKIVFPMVIGLVIAYCLWHAQSPGFGIILLLTAAIISISFAVLELKRFWSVGLLGANARLDQGINLQRSLQLCHNELWFLGLGASKLSKLEKDFEAAIKRCHRKDGTATVRFLLVKPENPLLTKAAKQAGRNPQEYTKNVQESLEKIRKLKVEKDYNIEVRFLSPGAEPLFRLMFIDNTYCFVSYYVFGEGDGTQLPQFYVSKGARDRDVETFYYPFRSYFEQLWNASERMDFNTSVPLKSRKRKQTGVP